MSYLAAMDAETADLITRCLIGFAVGAVLGLLIAILHYLAS